VQEASIAALSTEDSLLSGIRDTYQERRDVLCNGLNEIGISVKKPKATFYVWTKVPTGYTSATFVSHLLEKTGSWARRESGSVHQVRDISALHSLKMPRGSGKRSAESKKFSRWP